VRFIFLSFPIYAVFLLLTMGDGKWVAAGLKDTLDSPSSAAIESAVSLEKSLPFHNLFRSIVERSWVAGPDFV